MSEAERWLDIEMDNGVVDMEKRRSAGAGRRESDVGSDDLRALIQSESDARRRDQEVYDRRFSEHKQEREELKQEIKDLRQNNNKLVMWVARFNGALVVLVLLLNWIGPTVVRRLIDSLAGTGP